MAKTKSNVYLQPDSLQAAAQQLEVRGPNSLLYNAQVIDYMTNTSQGGGATALAWYFYSQIPELRYTTRYVSNALSIANLYVGESNPNGPPTRLPDGHPANDLLSEFAGGKTGQSDLLDRLGLHLTVAGDSVAMGPKTGTSGQPEPFDKWRIYSTEEVSSRNGRIYIRLPSNAKEQPIPDSVIAVRIWRPHPVYWWDADSPVKGSFSVLRELDLLDQHVHASAMSRLAGAGLMGIPDELDLPNADSEIDGTEVDKFVALLTEVMGLAIKKRDSAAALVPIMLRGPAEYIDKIQHFDFTTEFSQMIPDLRMTAIRRLALGMDVPPEILLGSAQSTSWCLDDQTEIYTRRGWLSEPEIQIGDECLSLNHETGMSEWQPVTDVYRADVVDEKMLSIEGSWHSSLTTMGHRWPVLKAHGRDKHWEREWTTSEEILDRGLKAATDSQIPIKLQRAARLNDLPSEPKYTDALVELVAWMFTEGSIDYREGVDSPHRAAIFQSHVVNSKNCSRIRSALTTLYGPEKHGLGKIGRPTKDESKTPWWREVIEGNRTRFILNKAAFSPIIEHCPRRIVKYSFVDSLTYSQLLLFINIAASGDGTIYRTGHVNVGQKDPRMLDAVEKAAILAGLGVMRYSAVHDGFHKHTQHYVSITPNRLEYRPRGKNITEQRYTGRIWCPTVPPTHSIFIKRDGKTCYTGQSAWQTDEATLRVHLIPLLQLITSSLTTGWLHPQLEELPLSKAQREQIPNLVVHFDVSNLKIRQDISGDAQALFDRFEIDADALRKATGYGEDSAPDDKELAKQVLFSLVRSSTPELVNYGIKGLRDNFGIDLLPEVKEEAPPPGPGAPPGPEEIATTEVDGPLPGDRSQDKQISPPPVPKVGDNSNNEPAI